MSKKNDKGTQGKTPKMKKLRGLSDVRRFFYKNDTPIYFISATNFNLLGADEWIKGFRFICYIECFDGLHPNVFAPQEEAPHDAFESIEDINNYLLEHKEVIDFIDSRRIPGQKSKALFLMFNERTEELAKKLDLEVCFPSAAMRTSMDNKVNTNRIAEKAKVPCVPYVLGPIKGYAHLCQVSKALGTDLVVQTPFGDSGHTTFFISNEEEFDKYADEITKEGGSQGHEANQLPGFGDRGLRHAPRYGRGPADERIGGLPRANPVQGRLVWQRDLPRRLHPRDS